VLIFPFSQSNSREGDNSNVVLYMAKMSNKRINNKCVPFICASATIQEEPCIACLELISVCVDILSFLRLIRDVAKL
jgi:hypothetical protein